MSFNYDIVELVAEDESGLVGKHPSWERVRLGDVALIQNGAAFDSSFFSESEGVNLLRIRDIVAGKTRTKYNGPVLESPEAMKGDVLVGMDGDFNCRIWSGEKALVNQRVCKIVVDEELYNKYFMYHAMYGYLKLINDNTSSVTVKHLSSKTISDIPLPLPPANEQTRIVSKIEELFTDLDKGEESLRRAQALLKKYRQSVLKAAVTGELTREWREKNKDRLESGEALLKRILKARREAWEKAELAKMKAKGKKPKDDSWKARYVEPAGADTMGLPELPEGWAWATLDMLAFVKGGVTVDQKKMLKDSQEVPYLRVANVQDCDIDLTVVKSIKVSRETVEELRLIPGDILLNEGGDLDKLGRGWVWSGQIPVCIHQNHVFRARPVAKCINSYFVSYYTSVMSKSFFMEMGKQTTNLASISLTKIKSLPIPVSGEQEVLVIIEKIKNLLQSLAVVRREVERRSTGVQNLRQSILERAFTGKLVPQDPTDEPASELLKRITAQKAAQAVSRPRRATGPRKKTAPPKPAAQVEALAAAPAAAFAPVPADPKKSVQTLAQQRKTAGLSQTALAKAVGLNQAYISQMETGKRAVTEEQRQALATVLGVSPDALR